MALTRIDLDEDTLSKAVRLSGAKTKKDAVNLALREFAAPHGGRWRASISPRWRQDWTSADGGIAGRLNG